MARPGVMLYFDMLEPIRVLPDADKGRLLVAILEYGKDGVVPTFDGMLALAWGFVRPKIDMDGESYENTKVQRKYAAFCKKRSALKLPKISMEEWAEMDDDERQRMLMSDNEPQRPVDFVGSRYPTTTTITTPTPITTTTPTPITTTTPTPITTTITTAAAAANTAPGADARTAAAADIKLKILHGELGQGVVHLSDYQIDILLDKMGIELFDYYVEKLADFIIREKASVKSHYQTILKWWTEDGTV